MSAAGETDQERDAPHPRETYRFYGHQGAEAELAAAFDSGHLHHAWLITGPKGVGKATLAYRFARVALKAPRFGPRPLDVDPDSSIARRIAELSHADLFILRRGLNERGKPRGEIVADQARELGAFFALKPAEGGFRIAVIDAADDLNRNAANAILKTLEEPPPRTAILLISHSPGALLPTIRSRCRRLALRPLRQNEMREALGDMDAKILDLAHGRPGRALALKEANAGKVYAELDKALNAAMRSGDLDMLAHAFRAQDREAHALLVFELTREWLGRRLAQESGKNDLAVLGSLAEAFEAASQLEREAANLDMDMVHALSLAHRVVGKALRPCSSTAT
jgi:DNA polymerase-3 subunit delta'